MEMGGEVGGVEGLRGYFKGQQTNTATATATPFAQCVPFTATQGLQIPRNAPCTPLIQWHVQYDERVGV